MKKILFGLMIMGIVSCSPVWKSDIPALKGRVNDYSETLSVEESTKLEAKLKSYEDSTSTQIAILMMKSLGNENLENFSIKVAENWKIGQKGKNNGVILLFFMHDKKDRIEVGYGLEPRLTDVTAQWILDKEVKPRFQKKKYYEGIDVATDKIIASLSGEYQQQIAPLIVEEGKNNSLAIALVVLALFAGLLGYIHWTISGIAGAIGLPLAWFFVFGTISLTGGVGAVVVGFLAGLICHLLMSVSFGGEMTGSSFGEGVVFSSGDSSGGLSGGGGDFGGGGASGGW